MISNESQLKADGAEPAGAVRPVTAGPTGSESEGNERLFWSVAMLDPFLAGLRGTRDWRASFA